MGSVITLAVISLGFRADGIDHYRAYEAACDRISGLICRGFSPEHAKSNGAGRQLGPYRSYRSNEMLTLHEIFVLTENVCLHQRKARRLIAR